MLLGGGFGKNKSETNLDFVGHLCYRCRQHIVERTEVANRVQVQDQHLSFRANSAIVAELANRADKAGCSVSEYLRSLVREKVGLQ